MAAPSRYAYGVRSVQGNVVYLGRLQPARRTDSELARAIEAHVEQMVREQREREDQYADLRGLVRVGMWLLVFAACLAVFGGQG